MRPRTALRTAGRLGAGNRPGEESRRDAARRRGAAGPPRAVARAAAGRLSAVRLSAGRCRTVRWRRITGWRRPTGWRGAVGHLAGGWPGDIALAVVTAGWLTGAAWTVPRAAQHWVVLVLVVAGISGSVLLRRRWPLPAATVATVAVLIAHLLGAQAAANSSLTPAILWAAFACCYSLGAATSLIPGVALALAFGGALEYVNGSFSPVGWMVTAGPWLAGRVVQSRRVLTAQLAERNVELQDEQERFARESVRYERARIARELHDIVAHSLSAMVVQATAGQRLSDVDPGSMAEAMQAVASAAGQAEQDIGQLVELLAGGPPAEPPPALPKVCEVVRRATAAGLDVTCRFGGPVAALGRAASQTAYRVIQEALTNALKHAPGAPVLIVITGVPLQLPAVGIVVTSGPARQPPSGLAQAGAGYGLTAMRERVTACGGTMTAGPAAGGGWEVRVTLPAASS